MLDAAVAFVVVLLIATGVLVMLGPRRVMRRLAFLRPSRVPAVFETRGQREALPTGLHPKTQRVVVAASRLANWMRAHGHEDVAREIRSATARLTGNEASGLYALQTTLRRIRVVNISDTGSQERLKALVSELRTAVEDRFEQLELLPFRRP